MRQGRRAAVLCTAVLALILLFLGAFYLMQQGGNAPMQTESSTPPGTLSGVMYAIVETFYYPEEPPKGVGWHDRFEKENVPISAEQWADVEQVVLELYPLMKPKPEPTIDLWSSLGRWLGGAKDDEVSSSSITLIWDTEEGEQRIKYSSPNDKPVA